MSDLAKGPSAVKADKNPKGGLSAQGRKKFGVQAGVKNYASASRKDKGRWVSWALRFTGSPKPLKDSSGNPTRYALMFRAWGEKVPTSTADVTAVHKKAMKRSKELKNSDAAGLGFADLTDDFKEDLDCADCDRSFLVYSGLLNHLDTHLIEDDEAKEFKPFERKAAAKKGQAQPGGSYPIRNEQDLKNAISAYGRSKNKAATKAHIIKRAKALKLTKLLPDGWGSSTESASGVRIFGNIDCPHDDCARSFTHENMLFEHAEAVHTFNDIERLVSEEVREKYHKPSDYRASPPVYGIYAWVQDISTDWVVFMVEEEGDSTLYKASYSILDSKVSLGEPVEVKRRTVYDPVTKTEDDD